jgi:hypothetical protein
MQELLKLPWLILGRDLNLTLSNQEIWGSLAWQDPLVNFFVYKFEEVQLVDIDLVPLIITW